GEGVEALNAVRPGHAPGPERVEAGADRRAGPRRDDGDRLSAHRLASPSAAARTATFTDSPRLRLRLARPRSQTRLASGCGSHGHVHRLASPSAAARTAAPRRPPARTARRRRATLRGAVSSTCER